MSQPPEITVTCRHCRFAQSHSEEDGECHRFPPVYRGVDCDEKAWFVYPSVFLDEDWCGEFQPLTPIPPTVQ